MKKNLEELIGQMILGNEENDQIQTEKDRHGKVRKGRIIVCTVTLGVDLRAIECRQGYVLQWTY